jgi:cobalamin synthase
MKNPTIIPSPIGQIKSKPDHKVKTLPAARVKKRLLFEPVHRATPSTRCSPPLLLLLLLLLPPPPAARTHHQIAQILLHVVAICGQSVCCRHMGGARRFRRPQ